MQNFLSAHANPVVWTPTGLGAVTLNVTEHTFKSSTVLFDVSNSGSKGRTARIHGKNDSGGNVKADFDIDQPFYKLPPNIDAGVPGVMVFMLHDNSGVQIPCIVEDVNGVSGGQNTEVKYDFNVKENCLAGLFVWPAA